jgi:hypothetical protein
VTWWEHAIAAFVGAGPIIALSLLVAWWGLNLEKRGGR